MTNIIKQRREELGLTLAEVAEAVGVSSSTVMRWESGFIKNMGRDKIEALCRRLHMSPITLLGMDAMPDNTTEIPKMRTVPVIGEIACGVPALAEQNHIGTAAVPEGVSADFALICRGDSMINARINNGDIVFIRRQPMVENNQIAAVRIGTEATLKRVRFIGGKVVLWPENPAYEPIMVTEDMDVEIMGLAVCFFSQVI